MKIFCAIRPIYFQKFKNFFGRFFKIYNEIFVLDEMTISANTFTTSGAGNVAGASTDRWALGLSFAF